MATPSSTPVEEDIMMCEVVISNNAESKAMPIDLDDLCQSTRFTRQEIRFMYRGLKTVNFFFSNLILNYPKYVYPSGIYNFCDYIFFFFLGLPEWCD